MNIKFAYYNNCSGTSVCTHPDSLEIQKDPIKYARQFAVEKHKGQYRKFGRRSNRRRYIYHPAQVVKYLKTKGYFDGDLLSAAWLHDVVEDCDVTVESLNNIFGKDVAHLVYFVTKPNVDKRKTSRLERWDKYLKHYSKGTKKSKILKLADRVCNLSEYLFYWNYTPARERQFVYKIYLSESIDLAETFMYEDESIYKDLVGLIDRLEILGTGV